MIGLVEPALADVTRATPADDAALPITAVRAIRNAAIRALVQELVTYPKPGLVSLVDCGSHDDMVASTFIKSSLALRHYFAAAAAAGGSVPGGCSFERLRELGKVAERRMLHATDGINTHRGAIFNIGLLAAGAGLRLAGFDGHGHSSSTLGDIVAARWGADIAQHRRRPGSNGAGVARRYGVGGALTEAAAGFPSLYAIALPAYRGTLQRGGSANQARVQTFFALMATITDTNLLHRGGPEGLAFAQDQAAGFLVRGGVRQANWHGDAVAIHRAFVNRRLSPGGAADLLAACVFVHSIEG